MPAPIIDEHKQYEDVNARVQVHTDLVPVPASCHTPPDLTKANRPVPAGATGTGHPLMGTEAEVKIDTNWHSHVEALHGGLTTFARRDGALGSGVSARVQGQPRFFSGQRRSHMLRRTLTTLTMILVLAACGESGGDGGVCTPGTTQSCLCPGGGTGVQTCLSDGSGWGTCDCSGLDTSTDPDVPPDTSPDTATDPGCVDATCNSECRDAGYAGGSCVAGSCQCNDDCTEHSDCPDTSEVCYGGECTSPWGRTWRFTVQEGHLPERQWWDGECYDTPCGPPDVFVEIYVDATGSTTSVQADTFNPSWYEYGDHTVTSSSTFDWTMFDQDLTVDDTIVRLEEPMAITAALIRQQSWIWQVDYESETYDILAIGIAEPD